MRQPIAILVTLLLSLPMLLAQSKSPEENPAMSDRAQTGLRGPVKSTTESSTYADASRKDWDLRSESTTNYDPEGRLLSSRNRNSDGSH